MIWSRFCKFMQVGQKYFLVLAFLTQLPSAYAKPIDPRTRLPEFFYNSSIGLTAGVSRFAFGNSNLPGGLKAASVSTTGAALRATIDHYFTPNFAGQISLMRPVEWVKYRDINNNKSMNSVWLSLFALSLKPVIKLNSSLKMYGEAGIGYISRHGFDFRKMGGIKSEEVFAWVLGGGFEYGFTRNWAADLNLLYTPPNHKQNQPYTFYTGLGIRYHILPPSDNDDSSLPTYLFPYNILQVGYMDKRLFYWDLGKYFTPPYIPIFWDSKLKSKRGLMLTYERNFYHTTKIFSLDWGVSMGYWTSLKKGNSFYTFSIFPEFKLWFLRTKYVDGYFTYEVAGPTYMSVTNIDGKHMGNHFTFQDLMGVGFAAGRTRNFIVSLRLVHFSNGNMFADNPGFNVPAMLTLGYSF